MSVVRSAISSVLHPLKNAWKRSKRTKYTQVKKIVAPASRVGGITKRAGRANTKPRVAATTNSD